MMQRYEQELFKRPMPKSTTRSATGPATTQVLDAQLQRAIDTMVALVVLVGDKEAGEGPKTPMPSLPVTLPTTRPVTVPAATIESTKPVTAPAATTTTAPR